MSSRGLLVWLGRSSLRSTTVIALVSTLLVVVGAVGLRRVVATRAANATSSSLAASASRTLSASALTADTASRQKVVGVFEGTFDAKTQKVTMLNAASENFKVTFKAFGRADANTPLPDSSYTRTFVRSCANPSGTVPCQSTAPANSVSGELRITNTGSLKFYNTRLIFTDFLDTRGGIPITANAFFNDGQVALNGKLGVSRDYGDVDPSGSQTRVWTFSFPGGSLQSFYFRYTIVADIGVATESVEPAAIQNNVDRSITINGQGFNSPTVTLLNASGATVATLALTATSATQLTATVPANTAAGIYSVRVTNAGGTAGGAGSSTLIGRLTVTGVPTQTLSGTVTTWTSTGPFQVDGAVTISGTILPGTVLYMATGATLTVGPNLDANGGIPGVTATSPAQIVFTRAPGATSWGGITATSAGTLEVAFRNCVVEYGGGSGGAQINISGSGRTLRFTDSISRRSGGDGLRAAGSGDYFTGFTRSRIENNGGIGILLSANAALGVGTTGAGMGELGGGNANTNVPDQSYFYSLANVIRNNGTNAVQIDAAANDFTRSGVLVGQGDIPIQIRGANGNPSLVGNSSGSPGAEVSINPNAIIQLDAGMDFMAGNGTLFGNIAANGYAGYSHSPSGDTSISQRIVFDKIPGGGNFGALFFSSTSAGSSILNFASVRNGGSSPSGNAQVIIDSITYTFSFTNSESNNSSTYGLQFRSSTSVNRGGTSYTGNSTGGENVISTDPTITTIAGGLFGDGNQANQAPLIQTIGMAIDPGRGVYFIETTPSASGWFIRFANTTNAPLKIAGVTVPANSIKNLTSGRPTEAGIIVPNDTPMDGIDLLDKITGVALSADRNVLFFTNVGFGFRMVNWINVSPGADTGTNPIKLVESAPTSVRVGHVGTLYDDPSTGGSLSDELRGIAVNPATKVVYVADKNRSRVMQISPAGAISTFAGGPDRPRPFGWRAFPFPATGASPAATDVALALPEAITVNSDGTIVYISDSDFHRVVRVQGGNMSLVTQLGSFDGGGNLLTLPMPTGLSLFGGNLYIATGGDQTIVRIDNPGTVAAQTTPSGAGTINTPPVNLVAGTTGTACTYSSNVCGDGGVLSSMGFDLRTIATSLGSDSTGLFALDQVANGRGRIRFLNLSGSGVTLANVSVAAGQGNTVIGSGLASPYNGGLATSAILTTPVGVALDINSNLFIAENNLEGSALRFVNRGSTSMTLLGQTVAPGAIIRINKDAQTSLTEDSTNPNEAYFYALQGLKWTSEGLYVVDSLGKNVPTTRGLKTSRLRFINLSGSAVTFYGSLTVNPGEIKTIAGGSTDPSDIGDGLIATSAKLLGTTDVEVDPTTKDIYLSEAFAGSSGNTANRRVRKILRATGIISSLALPTNQDYTGLAFDNTGRLLITAVGASSSQILRETAVGGGAFASVPSSITINRPRDVAADSSGNIYVMNSGSQQILKLPVAGGTATNFAGTANTAGFAGDGGIPTSARISIDPSGMRVDTQSTNENMTQTVGIVVGSTGEVIFADAMNNRVRRVK